MMNARLTATCGGRPDASPSRVYRLTVIAAILVNLVCTSLVAQEGGSGGLPSLSSAPVTVLLQNNGDVFLQRDLALWVQVISEKTDPAWHDHGRDTELWADYLNRPHPSVETMARYFADAAEEFGVPVELLQAIGYVESNWTQYGPTMDRGWGVMRLVSNHHANTLEKAADLLGVAPQILKDDASENIRGAATVLRDMAPDFVAESPRVEDWFDTAREYTSLSSDQLRESLAKRYYDVIRNGATASTLWGEEVRLQPHPEVDVNGRVLYPRRSLQKSADYPPAISNLTTCNYSPGRPRSIDTWVNHWIGSGTYEIAIDWFMNCSTGASAHFVIRASDGEITQVVRIGDTAWHAGSYSSPDNNTRSIGVEHEATLSNPDNWYSAAMLQSSATMARHFMDVYGIPRAYSLPGVQGHNDMPGTATQCPGNIPWETWLSLVEGVDLKLVSSISVTPVPMVQGSPVTITVRIRNDHGSETFTGKIAAALYSADGNYVGTIDDVPNDPSAGQGGSEGGTLTIPPSSEIDLTFYKSSIKSFPGNYQVRINAQPDGTSGPSSWSLVNAGAFVNPLPTAISGGLVTLSGEPIGPTSVQLTWNGAAGATLYGLERFDVALNDFKQIYCSSQPGYLDSGPHLAPNTEYTYRVRAGQGGGELCTDGVHPGWSVYSNTVTLRTLPDSGIYLEILDIFPDYIQGLGEVVSDPVTLSQGGEARVGAATDGVTQLLLRAWLPDSGLVEFCLLDGQPPADGGLDEPGGGARKGCVSGDSHDIGGGKHRAFAVYRVPEAFGDAEASERIVRVIVRLNTFTGEQFSTEKPITLVRPPLVFIHGLWSDRSTWWFPLVSDGRWGTKIFADYGGQQNAFAAGSFSSYSHVAPQNIFNALRVMRNVRKIAVMQADVAGHSMGGLLTRIWSTDPTNRRAENLQQGDINKLFTLDTPHDGSPLADVVIFLRDLTVRNPFTGNMIDVGSYITELAEGMEMPIDRGAIDDLSKSSPEILGLEHASIPTHALVGIGGAEVIEKVPGKLGKIYKVINFFAWLTGWDIFEVAQHDLVVGNLSQTGGLPDDAKTVIGGLDGIHISVPEIFVPGNTGSTVYSDRIAELLHIDPAGSEFAEIPSNTEGFPLVTPSLKHLEKTAHDEPLVPMTIGVDFAVPLPGDVVSSGDSVRVVVEPANGAVITRVLLVTPSLVDVDEEAPFEFDVEIPAETIGAFNIMAAGADDAGVFYKSPTLSLNVDPQATLTSIDIVPGYVALFGEGSRAAVRVLGTYDDGVQRDITDPAFGTQYTVMSTAIATVSESGELQFVAEGETSLLATNGPFEATAIVTALDIIIDSTDRQIQLIDIKPGNSVNPINPTSRGKTSVALLSGPGFDATADIDLTSLTFGRNGGEPSLHRLGNGAPNCNQRDVNGDGSVDLVCRFLTSVAGFKPGDVEGVLRGELLDGTPFEGRDFIATVGSDLDLDNDGVEDEEEESGPNAGDGNGDGVPDSVQENVTSLRSAVTREPITIVSSPLCRSIDVRSLLPQALPPDPGYVYPQGLIALDLVGIGDDPCSSAALKIFFHGESNVLRTTYRKVVNGQWSTMPADFNVEIVGDRSVATVALFLEDGGLGDSDGVRNGIIKDPGGPAQRAPNAIPSLSPVGMGILFASLLVAALAALNRKRSIEN